MWFRGRRWVELLELIEQLPSHSRLSEAQQNDPVWAEYIVDQAEKRKKQHGDQEKWHPPVRDWDLQAMLLHDIRETLVAVRQAVIQSTLLPQANGGVKRDKAPKVSPFPTPRTEVDRIKARRSRLAQLEIVALFAPHALDDFVTGDVD